MTSSLAKTLPHVRPIDAKRANRFPAEEPEDEHLGQSTRHFLMCKVLYELLVAACTPENTVGADNFVYFDAANPRRKLAPDGFVKLGVPAHHYESYLVWEEGTPEVAFEILSPSDTPERWTFEEKLRRYLALGIRELVVFNVDAPAGERLRVWDRIDHDLVERVVENERTVCLVLGLTLLVGPASPGTLEEVPATVRFARDPEGQDVIPTNLEALAKAEGERAKAEGERAKAEGERAKAEGERAKAEDERARALEEASAAKARILELERLLRGGG